jgi:ribosomal-protein-alanine N-acetyltransferase
MSESDLDLCARVEREAFPSLFPPTSFGRELKNRLANYLVVEPVADDDKPGPVGDAAVTESLIKRLISSAAPTAWRSSPEPSNVVGFIGVWDMADEAHIVNIGVTNEHRGNGLGELLLIAAVEHAQQRGARIMTLEVRESNFIARNLYRKYGFTERGLRKGYYSDNREDAVIMTTEPITGPAFREGFAGLVSQHALARSASVRRIS